MTTSLTPNEVLASDGHIQCEVKESQARSKQIYNPDGPDTIVAEFYMLLDITALQETVYIPISIASGKKPTGLVYEIEGTGESAISTADISCRGEGVSDITLGTLRYAKIPLGTTASFRILVEIQGRPGKEYKIVINRINYKLDTSDVRYKKFETVIGTEILR